MQKLKTLVFDIETFPMEVRVWQLGEQRVNISQIVKDCSLAAWGAKWLGKRGLMYADRSMMTEKELLKGIWKLLNAADIVITQNGENFDSRKLNAWFIENEMKPPKPYKHLDTYKIAKKVAEFSSHKLEYLTEKLNKKYKKLSHKNFPGQTLWDECLAGNQKAWAEMRRYNLHDVLSTEELYENLKAWTSVSAPAVYPNGEILDHCSMCGSKRLWSRGYTFARVSKAAQFSCRDCGKWSFGKREKI